MTGILKYWTHLATALLLLVALWAVTSHPFVNLPGLGEEKYESFGKTTARSLCIVLAVAAVVSLLTMRRLTVLLSGIALGLVISTLSDFWQQIANLKEEAAQASDTESQEMIATMLAETHPAYGFWILILALGIAAAIAVLPFRRGEASLFRKR